MNWSPSYKKNLKHLLFRMYIIFAFLPSFVLCQGFERFITRKGCMYRAEQEMLQKRIYLIALVNITGLTMPSFLNNHFLLNSCESFNWKIFLIRLKRSPDMTHYKNEASFIIKILYIGTFFDRIITIRTSFCKILKFLINGIDFSMI